tara:strand:- start:287 stop:460 length:174 start_codon:yes stop_codon:yes gene_type:complete
MATSEQIDKISIYWTLRVIAPSSDAEVLKTWNISDFDAPLPSVENVLAIIEDKQLKV